MTELSNLCGLAQVRAVKKSCHAALVFSHIETKTLRVCTVIQKTSQNERSQPVPFLGPHAQLIKRTKEKHFHGPIFATVWRLGRTTSWSPKSNVSLLTSAVLFFQLSDDRTGFCLGLLMEEAAVHQLATSITQLTLCQVSAEEIDTATIVDKACQKLRGIPDVPPQRNHRSGKCDTSTTPIELHFG